MKLSKTNHILAGLASIIIGFILLFNPVKITVDVVKIIGWIIVITGILGVVSTPHHTAEKGLLGMLPALMGIGFGLLLASFPGFFVFWLIALLGILVIISALSGLQGAMDLGFMGVPFVGFIKVFFVLLLILGAVVVISPFMLVGLAGRIAGIGLIVNGIAEFMRTKQL